MVGWAAQGAGEGIPKVPQAGIEVTGGEVGERNRQRGCPWVGLAEKSAETGAGDCDVTDLAYHVIPPGR